MRSNRLRRRGRRRDGRLLSALLALLLALAPLPALAQPMPGTPSNMDTGQGAIGMPCHAAAADQAQANRAAPHRDCPHCSGDAAAAACECAGHTAPPGLSGLVFASGHRSGPPTPAAERASDSPTDSPGGRLFRPPIFGA